MNTQRSSSRQSQLQVDAVQPAPRLVIIVGSLWQSLVEYPRLLRGSACLLVDVPSEIDNLKIDPRSRRSIHAQRTGRRCTIRTLAEKFASSEQKGAMQSLANMSLEDGIGQVPAFGAMSVQEVMERADYKQFRSELPDTFLAAGGGELPRIVVDAYFGTAGGQASWAGLLLWDDILTTLVAHSAATIDCSVHLVGGVSFAGPEFMRTQLNSSASVVRWLHRSQNLPDSRVNMSLYLSELPPVGTNKELRTQLLLDGHSALHAPAVAQNLQTMRSNRAASGILGNVLLTRCDHFQGISKQEISQQVAAQYAPALRDVCRVPADRGLVDEIYFEYDPQVNERPDVHAVFRKAVQYQDPSILSSLIQVPRKLRVFPEIALHDGTKLDLSAASDYFTQPVTTLREARRRLQQLRSIIPVMKRESDELDRLCGQFEDALEEQLEECEDLFERMLRAGNAKAQDQLIDGLQRAREIYDTLEEMDCEYRSLTAIRKDLQTILTEFEQRMRNLSESVRRCMPRSTAASQPQLIVPLSLETQLGRLLSVSDMMAGNYGWMSHTLSTMTAHVTAEGLAHITGAPSASVESIIPEVTRRQHARRGPNWGGVSREVQNDAFVVYPPVSTSLRKSLVAQHTKLGHDLNRITFAEAADCSVNVSVLELRTCSEMSEIVTQYYQTGLKQILTSDMRSLFMPDTDILTELGITKREA